MSWRQFRKKVVGIIERFRFDIADCLSTSDLKEPEIFAIAVSTLLEDPVLLGDNGNKLKLLADIVNVQDGTIFALWAEGENLPEDADYRQWMLERFIRYLRNEPLGPLFPISRLYRPRSPDTGHDPA